MSAPGYTVGDTSITVGSTSNWSTDTGVTFAIDQAQVVNGVEVQIAGTYNEYVGTVASGTSVSNVSWVLGTGDRNYASGALTRVYIPVSANRENRIVTWGLSHANQDGTLKTTAVQAALNTNQVGSTDWTILATAPTLQSSNGQREYVIKYTGVDYTDRLQAGTKLKIPRTVAAPTQSTSLNGTNQYWSKTSPAGMTFTDDWAAGAWITGLTAYGNTTIESRFNGTSGWQLAINSSGQVTMIGYNAGSTNYRQITSYQSVPLNKKVHVAAQMDMSAYTLTSTTCFIMIDGVEVPAFLSQGGTNPTALVQAGDYQIGALNGANFFNGKLAQVFVSSTKLTQAQVRAFKDQKLTTALATTYSMAAAFPFDGNGNDVSTNANNLTANNGATATDTDTAFSTDVFGIATKVILSGPDTLATVFCPTGAGVPNETLGTTSYSTARAPYGFPTEVYEFDVELLVRTGVYQASAVIGTIYNPGGLKLNVPVGAWLLGGSYLPTATGSTTADKNVVTALSTSSTTIAQTELSSYFFLTGQSVMVLQQSIFPQKVALSTATPYYFVAACNGSGVITNLGLFSANDSRFIARNAYL